MLYRGACWFTYDYIVTYRVGGTDRYVGYVGYKVCDPIHNPKVMVVTDSGIVYSREAPDRTADFFGEKFSIGNVNPTYVELYIVEENVRVRFEGDDIPPDPGISLSGFGGSGVVVTFGARTTGTYGFELDYTFQNYSGRTLYVKGEVYRDGVKICERQIQINNGTTGTISLYCDTPGSDGEVRFYKSKFYVAENSGGPWYHFETRGNFVYYYVPGKTVGDIVFRPSRLAYNIEQFLERSGLSRELTNFGKAGSKLDYVLMLCSMDSNLHQLRDDVGNVVASVQYKCRWRRVDTYVVPLGVVDRQLYLDGSPYKTVRMYGYGRGQVRRVESVSGYTSYRIDADQAVVRSVVGGFAFDYVDGVKVVDVSQGYLHSFLGVRGWAVENGDEYFAGFIATGSEYVKLYDRDRITIRFDSAYSGLFEVEKDGEVVLSTTINVPAGGEYTWDQFSGPGEYKVRLRWGSVASVKLINREYGGAMAECGPVFKVGVDALDSVVFCVGGYGITTAVLLIGVVVLLLLLRR